MQRDAFTYHRLFDYGAGKMIFSKSTAPTLALLIATSGLGCKRTGSAAEDSDTSTPTPRDIPVVHAVNYPLFYFAQRIGGESLDVRLPVPADVDPAFWRPAPADIAAFQKADIILLNGAGYARWTAYTTLPASRVVDTSKAFAEQFIYIEDAVSHAHGPQGAHTHGERAFTTWLDPHQAIQQARAVHAALLKACPGSAAALNERLAALVANLTAVDEAFEKACTRLQDRALLASHPVYHYFARRYGLTVHSMHWEPQAMPNESEWAKFAALHSSLSATIMLWEGQPLAETVARLKRHGVRVVVLETGANVPASASGSFVDVMNANARRLLAAGDSAP